MGDNNTSIYAMHVHSLKNQAIADTIDRLPYSDYPTGIVIMTGQTPTFQPHFFEPEVYAFSDEAACSCKHHDAQRCASQQRLKQPACKCKCHAPNPRTTKTKRKKK